MRHVQCSMVNILNVWCFEIRIIIDLKSHSFIPCVFLLIFGHSFQLLRRNIHLSYPRGNGDAKFYENFSKVKQNNLDQRWIQVEWPSRMNRSEIHVPELHFPSPMKAKQKKISFFLLLFPFQWETELFEKWMDTITMHATNSNFVGEAMAECCWITCTMYISKNNEKNYKS